jgi:hypothetical protein
VTKPLKNGHDPSPVAESPNASTIRSRRFRDRKRRGIVVLRDVEIAPDLVAAMVECGWLHEAERCNRDAISASLGALIMRALGSGVTPSQKPLLAVDLEAIQDALPWLKPETPINSQTAAKALETVSRCAKVVGFGPEAYAARLNALVAEIEARGIVGKQSMAH